MHPSHAIRTVPDLAHRPHRSDDKRSPALLKRPTLYAVTIDTEEEWNWSDGWPIRSHSLRNIAQLPRFQGLCSSHGAKITAFANWSVMNDAASRQILLNLGDRESMEIGMHIHPWLTPPYAEGKPGGAFESFLANLPPESIHEKLQSVYDLFENEGLKPTSFRGGRYSSGGVVHEFLRARGFIADASVVPFTTWSDDGAPDYRQRDLTPARLAPRGSEQALWEIPVTRAFTRAEFKRWAARFDRLEHSFWRRLRAIGILQRLGVVKRVWLNFEDTPAGDMLALLRVLRVMQLPCITLTVHSSSLMPGGNPYSSTQDDVKRIWSTIDEVLSTLRDWEEFQPATVSQIAEHLESDYEGNRHQPTG